jgi:hypothetical protein
VIPADCPLYDTRESRSSAAYQLYHELNGNIITFLNDISEEGERHEDGSPKARVRIRHCPGFSLLAETHKGRCRQGETYHVTVTRHNGDITFAVNGTETLRVHDPQPCGPGLLGLRTFSTELWWDNIRLRALD